MGLPWALWETAYIDDAWYRLCDTPIVYKIKISLKCYGWNSGQGAFEIHHLIKVMCFMLLKQKSEWAIFIISSNKAFGCDVCELTKGLVQMKAFIHVMHMLFHALINCLSPAQTSGPEQVSDCIYCNFRVSKEYNQSWYVRTWRI